MLRLLFRLKLVWLLGLPAPLFAQWSSVDGYIDQSGNRPIALDQTAPPIQKELPDEQDDDTPDTELMSDLKDLSKALTQRNQAYVRKKAENAAKVAAASTPKSQPQIPHLSALEAEFARTAWRYFETTTDPNTGLVRSTLKFPSTTLWDQGGYLLAVVSAQRLGLITRQDAVTRMDLALHSLAQMPLNNGTFPNKAYNTETLQMTDYANKAVPNGIGYSALDIMRLISGMIAVEQAFPEIAKLSQFVRNSWPLHDLVVDGRYHSTTTVGSRSKGLHQEGRIGYEQYAGRVGIQIGLEVAPAAAFSPILRWHEHQGVRIPGDLRNAKTHGIDAVTTSEPFLLEALEYGWRPELRQVASAVFLAQLHRYNTTGKPTALSEDHIAGAPYFAYGGILVGNRPFETVTPRRKVVNEKRRVSTKASFGWWALTNHDYATLLVNMVAPLQTEYGWQAGIFEEDGTPNTIVTLNTNAVVLQALHYRAFGPLIQDVFAGRYR